MFTLCLSREIKSKLKMLRVEAMGLDPKAKQELMAWVAQKAQETEKIALLGKRNSAENAAHQDKSTSLRTLQEAKRTMANTEHIAQDTMEELAGQRQILERNMDRNQQVQRNLSAADKLVKGLSRWWHR